MTPLLFAAALAASDPSTPTPPLFSSVPPRVQQRLDAAAACNRLATLTVAPDGVPLRKLGDLPAGQLEHAVWRTVAGCPVREVISGRKTYYVRPSIVRLEKGPDRNDGKPHGLDRRPLTPDGR